MIAADARMVGTEAEIIDYVNELIEEVIGIQPQDTNTDTHTHSLTQDEQTCPSSTK